MSRDDGLVDLGSKIAGVLDGHDPERTAERVREQQQARLDHAREVVADQAWDRIELPAWVRERWPRLDLTDPTTLPEPDRCAEGRPWGVDAYGSVWGSLDERWRGYVDGTARAQRCRNRWRDRDTLLCGTHLAAWRRTLDDAAKRVRQHEAHERATRLCRQLADLGVLAEPKGPGVLLLRADAEALVERLGADRDALLDLDGAVTAYMLGDRTGAEVADAQHRMRRHLDRTTRTTPAPDPNREA